MVIEIQGFDVFAAVLNLTNVCSTLLDELNRGIPSVTKPVDFG